MKREILPTTEGISMNIYYILALLAFSSLIGNSSYARFEESSALYHGTYSENFVTRWGFQSKCDHCFDPRTKWPTVGLNNLNPQAVKAGDIIFVRDVKTFLKTVHPKILNPYIMITAGDVKDRTREIFMQSLNSPKIIAWFSVHACTLSHHKFHPIPLGIIQTRAHYENRSEMTNFFAQLRQNERNKLLTMNFLMQNKPSRTEVYKLFENASFCDKAHTLPFLDYLKHMAQFKFALSPRGVAIDTYRTWEAMLVGTIPVVESSQLDGLYADLPILIIKDWNEITPSFLEQKYKEMTSKKYNIEKLFMEYWWKKIEDVQRTFLNKIAQPK